MSGEKPKLQQPSRLRLVDDVRHSLQDAILAGRMEPGERLVEMWISEQLGVSRTTVREALLMLEHDGLVVSKPRQGTFVTRLSPEEATDLSLVRALLEGFAVSAGSPCFKEDILTQLEGYLDEMRLCRLPDDYPRLIGLDLAFHRLLVEGAQSPRLLELWASLNGAVGALFIRSMEYQHGDIDDVVALHQRLLDAVRSGDPHVAQQATIEHYIGAEGSGLGHDVPLMRLIDMLIPRYQMRQDSESPVVRSHLVGYPSPFIDVVDEGEDDGLPVLPGDRDTGTGPDDGVRLSAVPLSSLLAHLQ